MDEFVAKLMGWKFMICPYFIFLIVRFFAMMKYLVLKFVMMQGENLPGAPPHLYMDLSLTQKTFDNSKCRRLLNWEPQDSWVDVMTNIVNEYKAKQTNCAIANGHGKENGANGKTNGKKH